MRNVPRHVIVLVLLVVTSLSFTIGITLGKQQGARASSPEGEGLVKNIGDIPSSLSDDVDFRQFWDVWNLIKETYVHQPVSDKDLYYGAMHGLVAGIGDDYTVYFDPEEAEQFTSNLEGSFAGLRSARPASPASQPTSR